MAILISGKNNASKAFDEASKSANGFGKTLTDVAKIAGGFVLAKGLLALPALFDGPVKAASNLGESMNAVQVIFGRTSDKIMEFGKVSATQAGLSQRAFNELVTPLGAMLKNSGLSMDQVADKTIDLTKRAADMASVFNTDVSDALGAITAGLRGEADPLERYGVKLNAAAIEAEALASGLVPIVKNQNAVRAAQLGVVDAQQKFNEAIKKAPNSLEAAKASLAVAQAQEKLAAASKGSTGPITDQIKAQAALNLIMKQTADVAGDFVNTSDGLANKQRIQAARAEEVSAALGQKLMPVMLKFKEIQLQVVEALGSKLIPLFEQLSAKYMPQVSAAFDEAVAAVTPFIEQIEPFFTALSQNEEVMSRVAVVIGGVLVTALGALTVALAGVVVGWVAAALPIVAIGVAIAALSLGIRELVIHWDEITAKFPILGQAVDFVKQKFAELKVYWESQLFPAIGRIKDRVVEVVTAVITFLQQNWPLIKTIMGDAVQLALAAIRGPMNAIAGVIKVVVDIINGDWAKAWEDFKKLCTTAVSDAYGLIKKAFTLWTDLDKLLINAGTAIIEGLWKGMQNKWKDLEGWLGGLPGKIKDLKGPIEKDRVMLFDEGEATMEGFLNGLKSKYGDVRKWLNGVAADVGGNEFALQSALGGGERGAFLSGLQGFLNGETVAQEWFDAYGDELRNAGYKVNEFGHALKQNIPHFNTATNSFLASTDKMSTALAQAAQVANDYWSAAAQHERAYGSGSSSASTLPTGHGGAIGPANPGLGILPGAGGMGGGAGGSGGYFGTPGYDIYGNVRPGGTYGPGGPLVINITVEGSIRSDRDLAAVLAEQLALGAGRGVLGFQGGSR